ncbi:hypothetical protein [Desulfosporosinus youngiae]|uniref:Uncharacterized protein n=1 Tax=Desulfosporosinus youngiae DSM 17734 TaxID=768710 RepID=H5XXY1_9FIRM|nr:hypothetical protein [Desulfosporosinus youngiae]EHQ91484.1 hypothetical protein DesyoDRAFT_4530 [Desulfosporosinus youngiae DSM 17734]
MNNLETADQIIHTFQEKIDHPQGLEQKKKVPLGIALGVKR